MLLRQAAENLDATAAVAAASCLQLALAGSGSCSAAGVRGYEKPQLLCADSNQVVFETCCLDGKRPSVHLRVIADTDAELADAPRRKIDAMVSNLPYGRMVGVAASDVPAGDRGLEALAPLLSWLRCQADRHAFFSGTRLAPLLRALGYEDVDEVCVDERGRRFLALASGGST